MHKLHLFIPCICYFTFHLLDIQWRWTFKTPIYLYSNELEILSRTSNVETFDPVPLLLSSQFTFAVQRFRQFNGLLPEKTRVVNDKHIGASVEATEYLSNIYFPFNQTTCLRDFKFLFINDTDFTGSSSFAFARTLNDKGQSLVYTLKAQNYIDKNQFAINLNLDMENQNSHINIGYVYFGGFPDTILKIFKDSFTVPVGDTANYLWNVRLTNIVVGNTTIKNDYFSYFNTKSPGIYLPIPWFNQVVALFFYPDLKSKNCKWTHVNTIYCTRIRVGSFPVLKFVVGNKELSVSHEKLFKREFNGEYLYRVLPNPEREVIEIGHWFIQQYPMMFDYDHNEITFYSRSTFTEYQRGDRDCVVNERVRVGIVSVLKVNLLLNWIGVVGIVANKWHGRSRREEKFISFCK